VKFYLVCWNDFNTFIGLGQEFIIIL
jgi:hypothetical protein